MNNWIIYLLGGGILIVVAVVLVAMFAWRSGVKEIKEDDEEEKVGYGSFDTLTKTENKWATLLHDSLSRGMNLFFHVNGFRFKVKIKVGGPYLKWRILKNKKKFRVDLKDLIEVAPLSGPSSQVEEGANRDLIFIVSTGSAEAVFEAEIEEDVMMFCEGLPSMSV